MDFNILYAFLHLKDKIHAQLVSSPTKVLKTYVTNEKKAQMCSTETFNEIF